MVKKVLFAFIAIALMISPAVILAAPVAANSLVDIDIKPGSDPNSINVKEKVKPPKDVLSKGVLPIAILGSAAFNTTQVDPPTMLLSWDGISGIAGIPPLRWSREDVNGDGILDLGLKYSMGEIMIYTGTKEPPGNQEWTLMGYLTNGTPIEGSDTVRIINKEYAAGP